LPRTAVGLTRQLRFSARSEKIARRHASVTGIPISTLELKNAMTGQTVEDRATAYKQTVIRARPIFEFKMRTLVHFAVDTDAVLMTTRLGGQRHHFLPFNKGDGGARQPCRSTRPELPHRYLWKSARPGQLARPPCTFPAPPVDEKRDDQAAR